MRIWLPLQALLRPNVSHLAQPRASRAGLIAPSTLRGRRNAFSRLYTLYRLLISAATLCLPLALSALTLSWLEKLAGGDLVPFIQPLKVASVAALVAVLAIVIDLIEIYVRSVKYIQVQDHITEEERESLDFAIQLYERGRESEAYQVLDGMAHREGSRAVPLAAANAGILLRLEGERELAREAFGRCVSHDLQVDSRRIINASPDILQVLAAFLSSEQLEMYELQSASLLSERDCQDAIETLIRWGLVRQIDRPGGRRLFELRHVTPKPEDTDTPVAHW
jgi:hypothetical protein